MTPLKEAKIGYAAYSRDFQVAGDRRRFAAFARHRGLNFEYADLQRPYDVVIVAQNADLTGWAARKRAQGAALRLILDLADPYFELRRLDQRFIMAAGRYIEGRESRLTFDFQRTLRDACTIVDGVLCSAPEHRESLSALNQNVEVSFDWFDDELGPPKQSFERGRRLKLVWEGQAGTLSAMQTIRDALNQLRDCIELHVVTDPTTKRWFGRFGTVPAQDLLEGLECPVHVWPWERETFSRRITHADVAIIPMSLDHPIFYAKPENKLVLLWKLGMPVLVSATPAYSRAMRGAGLDMVCFDVADWATKIEALANASANQLAKLAATGFHYARGAYDWTAFCAPFDNLFKHCGYLTRASDR